MCKKLKNVFYCPECNNKGYKTKLKETTTFVYVNITDPDKGQRFIIPSIKRRVTCSACDFKATKVEMDLQDFNPNETIEEYNL